VGHDRNFISDDGASEFLSTLSPEHAEGFKGLRWKANTSLTGLDLRNNRCSAAKLERVAAHVLVNRDEARARSASLEEELLQAMFEKEADIEAPEFVRFMGKRLSLPSAKGAKAADHRERLLLDLYSAIDESQKCALHCLPYAHNPNPGRVRVAW
jgi:hypothetical protein